MDYTPKRGPRDARKIHSEEWCERRNLVIQLFEKELKCYETAPLVSDRLQSANGIRARKAEITRNLSNTPAKLQTLSCER